MKDRGRETVAAHKIPTKDDKVAKRWVVGWQSLSNKPVSTGSAP